MFFQMPMTYKLLLEMLHMGLYIYFLYSVQILSVYFLQRAHQCFEQCYLLMYFTGNNFCNMKLHLLCHIGTCIRNWGPLWSYSCFPFESMNHHIKRLFHGTRNMCREVCFLLFYSGATVDSSTCMILYIVHTITGMQTVCTCMYMCYRVSSKTLAPLHYYYSVRVTN